MRDPDKFISEKYDVYLDFRATGGKGDEHSWELKVRTPRFMELFKEIYEVYRKYEERDEEDGDHNPEIEKEMKMDEKIMADVIKDLKAHIKDLEEENKSLHERARFLSEIHYR